MSVACELKIDVSEMCEEIQKLQRQRAWYIKSRNMMANRLQATVAGTIGYSSGLSEKERQKKYVEATALIKQIVAGKATSEISGIVLAAKIAVGAYEEPKKDIEKGMIVLAKQLHVADWVEHKDQRGFGLLFLAIVIGETGNLFNYANPAKVWRRLGCAPHTYNGKTRMGATWKSGRNGKLPASEWEEFGYSPRRRSIAYLIGDGIVKLNSEGPYRARYDEARSLAVENHPEWLVCSKCKGTGKKDRKKCANCKGTGKVTMHCHLHGMLLATKLLLKNLWIEWNK